MKKVFNYSIIFVLVLISSFMLIGCGSQVYAKYITMSGGSNSVEFRVELTNQTKETIIVSPDDFFISLNGSEIMKKTVVNFNSSSETNPSIGPKEKITVKVSAPCKLLVGNYNTFVLKYDGKTLTQQKLYVRPM